MRRTLRDKGSGCDVLPEGAGSNMGTGEWEWELVKDVEPVNSCHQDRLQYKDDMILGQ